MLVSAADVLGMGAPSQVDGGRVRPAEAVETQVRWTVAEVCFKAGNRVYRIPLGAA